MWHELEECFVMLRHTSTSRSVPFYAEGTMDLSLIILLIGGLVVVSTAVGLLTKRAEGRVKTTSIHTQISPEDFDDTFVLGAHATLLQFSTEFCTKCPGTRKYLAQVANSAPGVAHIDVDITHRQDLAQKFKIMQTPTTFILDASGVVAGRIGGSPRPDAVATALDIALRRDHDNYVI